MTRGVLQQNQNWRLYVGVSAPTADLSGTNRWYEVGAVAWTLPGDFIGVNTNAFRPTAYDASLDALRLFTVQGTNEVELPLPTLTHGASDVSDRVVRLVHGNDTGVEIPLGVRELRAEVTMTLRHRSTGQTATKVFSTRMLKKDGARLLLPLD